MNKISPPKYHINTSKEEKVVTLKFSVAEKNKMIVEAKKIINKANRIREKYPEEFAAYSL